MNEKEKQQIFTFTKLEPETVQIETNCLKRD